MRKPVGRMKRSNFGGFLVNDGGTKVTFVIFRFHVFATRERALVFFFKRTQ
jgi:hypothetical protein